MENLRKRTGISTEVLILTVCSFLIGCAQTPQGNTGFPVRVGIQDANGLPVELQMDETKPLPVKAKVMMNETGPFKIVLDQNEPLSVKANVQADCVIQVELMPDRSKWLGMAAVGLIVLIAMIIALIACIAAVNANRAAKR